MTHTCHCTRPLVLQNHIPSPSSVCLDDDISSLIRSHEISKAGRGGSLPRRRVTTIHIINYYHDRVRNRYRNTTGCFYSPRLLWRKRCARPSPLLRISARACPVSIYMPPAQMVFGRDTKLNASGTRAVRSETIADKMRYYDDGRFARRGEYRTKRFCFRE